MHRQPAEHGGSTGLGETYHGEREKVTVVGVEGRVEGGEHGKCSS